MKIKYLFILPIAVIFILLGVSFAHAQTNVFTQNLYYGLQNNSQVTQLQKFLTAQGLYSGPVTGSFYSLTRNAVKAFQVQQGIAPTSGYFGPLTMAAANKITGGGTGLQTTLTAVSGTMQLQALLQEVTLLEQQLQAQSSTQAAQVVQPQVVQPTPTTTIQSRPQTSEQIQASTVSISAPVATTPSGFSWTPVGATNQRGKSANDEIADVTFNPANSGAILLNSMTVTFSGAAASSTGFLSGVKLVDPSGNTVPVLSQTPDCNGVGTCSVTFNFGGRLDSGAQTYKVAVNDTLEQVATGGTSVSLYVTINTNTDVTYTDAPSGGLMVNLPAVLQPGNQIFPLNLNSVTYAQGT